MKTVLAFLLSLSCLATAQTESPATQPTITEPIPIEEAPPVASRELRGLRKYSLGAEIGWPVFPVPAIGIDGAYFLDSKNLIEAAITTGKISVYFFSVQTTTYELRWKHFVGNSFYVTLGGGYRTVVLHDPSIPYVSVAEGDLGRAETLTANFSLGNQWQWDHFYLGVDWFGLMYPVTTFRRNYDSVFLNQDQRDDMDWIWEKVGKAWNISLTRLMIGWSF